MEEFKLLLGQTIEHCGCSLIIANEKDFVYIIVGLVVEMEFA